MWHIDNGDLSLIKYNYIHTYMFIKGLLNKYKTGRNITKIYIKDLFTDNNEMNNFIEMINKDEYLALIHGNIEGRTKCYLYYRLSIKYYNSNREMLKKYISDTIKEFNGFKGLKKIINSYKIK